MKTTNEIKAKVFAMYLGCLYIRDEKDENCLRRSLDGSSILGIGEGITNWGNAKLILKPLSSITDEHMIWVFDTANNLHEKRKLYPRDVTENTPLLKDFRLQISNGFAHYKGGYLSDSAVHQYLISKGYDVPLMLLGWKTLQESGLAIYEK
jgi:hypothetical protein